MSPNACARRLYQAAMAGHHRDVALAAQEMAHLLELGVGRPDANGLHDLLAALTILAARRGADG